MKNNKPKKFGGFAQDYERNLWAEFQFLSGYPFKVGFMFVPLCHFSYERFMPFFGKNISLYCFVMGTVIENGY